MGKYRTINNELNRSSRNDLNWNFDQIESDILAQKNLSNSQKQELVSELTRIEIEAKNRDNILAGTDIDVFISALDSAKESANNAATNADLKGNTAEAKGNSAEGKGNYAKNQGDYAKQKGDYADEKAILADEAAENANTEASNLSQLKVDVVSATQTANTNAQHAKTQGDYAKTQGDFAKIHANNALTNSTNAYINSNHAKTQGDYAKNQGDYALEAGNSVKTKWLTAVANYNSISATYPTPSHGDTVQTLNDGKIYRREGNAWVFTQQVTDSQISDLRSTVSSNKTELLTEIETVNTQLADIAINVKSLGVKGDGVSNDTVNLNRALAIGGEIYLPEGTYLIDSFNIQSNSKIYGTNKTVIKPFSSSSITLQFLGKENIEIENITFDSFYIIRGTTLTDCFFNKCKILNAKSIGLVIEQQSENVKVYNCEFENIGTNITNVNSTGFAINIYDSLGVDIRHNKISNTKGTSAIFSSNSSGLILDNDISDVVYRGIQFYSGSQNWEVKRNRISRCGLNNSSGSGVGCNGIYSSNLTLANIICEENTITDVVENGIEGRFKTIIRNTIINTGLNQTTNPTISTEGIYGKADVIDSNTIINARTRAISFVGESVADFQITNNVIKGAECGVYLNATGANGNMTDVVIHNNSITNTSKEAIALYVANGNGYNSVKVINNNSVNSLAKLASITRRGIEYVGESGRSIITNGTFVNWTDSTPTGWVAANTTLTSIIDGAKKLPQLTGNVYVGRIYRDIEVPFDKNILTVTVRFKSNAAFRTQLIPFNVDNTLDNGSIISFNSMSFDSNSFITEKYTFVTDNRRKFRFQVGIVGEATDLATISFVDVVAYNKE